MSFWWCSVPRVWPWTHHFAIFCSCVTNFVVVIIFFTRHWFKCLAPNKWCGNPLSSRSVSTVCKKMYKSFGLYGANPSHHSPKHPYLASFPINLHTINMTTRTTHFFNQAKKSGHTSAYTFSILFLGIAPKPFGLKVLGSARILGQQDGLLMLWIAAPRQLKPPQIHWRSMQELKQIRSGPKFVTLHVRKLFCIIFLFTCYKYIWWPPFRFWTIFLGDMKCVRLVSFSDLIGMRRFWTSAVAKSTPS